MNQAYIQALRREPITLPQNDLNALGSVIPHAVMASLLQDLESKQRALNQAEAMLLKAQSENEELTKVVKALQDYAEQLNQELQKKEEAQSLVSSQLVKTADVLTAIAEPQEVQDAPMPAVFRRRRT
jgi:septal ring factor EnvC (AmiA/AmiB activator)